MKKYLALALLCLTPLFGNDFTCTPSSCLSFDKWSVDGNIGYFYPFSKSLREVIPGGVNYQLLLNYKWKNHLSFFGGADYFAKNGHSTGTRSSTKLKIVPLTLGVKGSLDLWNSCDDSKFLQAYCLLGPRFYYVQSTNSVSYLSHHNYGHGFGGMGGLGLSYGYHRLKANLLLNASFGNVYTHSGQSNVETPNTQVGGLFVGAGIHYDF